MRTLKTITAMIIFFSASSAFAEQKEIWHGWADMPGIPCTRPFTYKDSFGITWPGVKTAPQEWHTYINLDLPSWGDIESKVKECALISAGVSGGAAFYLTPASAWPAFKATFIACASAKGISIAENLLSIKSGPECKW